MHSSDILQSLGHLVEDDSVHEERCGDVVVQSLAQVLEQVLDEGVVALDELLVYLHQQVVVFLSQQTSHLCVEEH